MTVQRSYYSKEQEIGSAEIKLAQEAAQLEAGNLPCNVRNCEECGRHYGRSVRKQQGTYTGGD